MAVVQLPPARPNLDTLLDAALDVGGEPDAFDFKETLDLRNDEHKIRLLRAVGAFGNTDTGGHLFLGISDDRRAVGLADEIADLYDQTRIQRIVNQHFAPPPAVQVRHHQRDGKKLVIVEVSPFREIPSVVTQTARAGKELLQAGTILFRNSAAESAVLSSESEMRKLCDAISKRRAQAIVEIFQRGVVGLQVGAQVPGARFAGLVALRERADAYWPSGEGHPPYIEVFFAPERDLNLTGNDMRAAFPSSSVPKNHGFPPYMVHGGPVETPMPWGWLGVIPFSELPNPKSPPGYLWMLSRDGSFLYREGFWEDQNSVIPNGVGLYHVAGLLILLLRFLDRWTRSLTVPDSTRFKLGTALNNVQGRYIEDERRLASRFRSTIPSARAEASVEEELGPIRAARSDAVVNLLEEIVWQFRGEAWSRQDLVQVVNSTHLHLGPEFSFPSDEKVNPSARR